MGSKVFAFGDIAGPVQFGKPAVLKKATHPELTERAAFVLASRPCRAYRVIRRSRSRVMPAASMAIARTVTSDMSIPVWASESAADVLPPGNYARVRARLGGRRATRRATQHGTGLVLLIAARRGRRSGFAHDLGLVAGFDFDHVTGLVQRDLGGERGGEVQTLPAVGCGVQRVSGVDFGGGKHGAALLRVQRREHRAQQPFGVVGHARSLTGLADLLVSVGQPLRVRRDGGTDVGDRLGRHGVGERVAVSAGRGRLGVGDDLGERVAVTGGFAALRQIVAQFGLCRLHDLAEELVVVQTAGCGCLAHDAAAHDVERIVRALHDAVVAALRGPRDDLGREFRHHRGERQAGRVERHRMTGRERLRFAGNQPIVSSRMVQTSIIVMPVGRATQRQLRGKSLKVVLAVHAAVVRVALVLVHGRAREVEVLLGRGDGQVADHAVEQIVCLLQGAGFGLRVDDHAVPEPFAHDRAESVPVSFAVVLVGVDQRALQLRVAPVDQRAGLVVRSRLVVDRHSEVVVALEQGDALVGHAAAEYIAVGIARVGLRLPVLREFAEQRVDVRLAGIGRIRRCFSGERRSGVRESGHQSRRGGHAGHGACDESMLL